MSKFRCSVEVEACGESGWRYAGYEESDVRMRRVMRRLVREEGQWLSVERIEEIVTLTMEESAVVDGEFDEDKCELETLRDQVCMCVFVCLDSEGNRVDIFFFI
jgi:hypothetical protein